MKQHFLQWMILKGSFLTENPMLGGTTLNKMKYTFHDFFEDFSRLIDVDARLWQFAEKPTLKINGWNLKKIFQTERNIIFHPQFLGSTCEISRVLFVSSTRNCFRTLQGGWWSNSSVRRPSGVGTAEGHLLMGVDVDTLGLEVPNDIRSI